MNDTQYLVKQEYFTDKTLLQCYNSQIAELPELPVGLTWLECDDNQLESLPTLPPNLTYLSCGNNQIKALPDTLPDGLIWLVCGFNQLMALPKILPDGLVKLQCYNNRLTSLPALPPGLTYLMCSKNLLTILPELPDVLTTLSCHSNRLLALPELPDSLKNLNAWDNQLAILPSLPGDLCELFCGYNRLSALPKLPNGLNKFSCDANQLTQLSNLPNDLSWLSCSQNQLTELDVTGLSLHYLNCSFNNLPDPSAVKGFTGQWDGINFIFYPQKATWPDDITASFTDPNFRAAVYGAIGKTEPEPIMISDVTDILTLDVSNKNIQSLAGLEHFAGLTYLFCDGNQLMELPEALPDELTWIFCSNNQLARLPERLPDGLDWLYCYDNRLTALPTLPPGLNELNCSGNQLSALPALPPGLTGLFCGNNQLSALPALPPSLKWLSCERNCLDALPETLPPNLLKLYCNDNKLSALPEILPDGLLSLCCHNNQLTKLPTLPPHLTELDCDGNRLTSLMALPIGLNRLNCSHNQLTELDITGLHCLLYLNCSYNTVATPSNIIGLPFNKWDDVNFIFNPQPNPVDKTAVEAAVAAFNAEPKPAGWMHSAYINGMAILDNEVVMQEAADRAAAELNGLNSVIHLINNIVVWCDRFEGLSEKDYTPVSWDAAQDACDAARSVCANHDATVDMIDAVWNDLYRAITALVFLPRLKPAPAQPGTILLRVGQTYQLKLDTNLSSLSYIPSNENITVDNAGLLRGVKAGTVVITVSITSIPGLILRLVVLCSD